MKKKRLNESPEVRENRLTRQREYKRKIHANESPELRGKRLAKHCIYQKKKIANESYIMWGLVELPLLKA